jgi:hypothetical protein
MAASIPCLAKFKQAFPDIDKYIRKKSGIDYNEETKEGRDKFIEAIKEVEKENIDNLKSIYTQLGIDETQTIKATVKTDEPVPTKEKPLTETKPVEDKQGAGKEPPTGEGEVEGGGDKGIGITHADTKEIRKERGLPEYEKEAETVKKWRAEANERIKKGELPELLNKMKRGEAINDVEQMMMGQHIANLDAELTKEPTKENLDRLNEAVSLSDKAGGTAWGRSGRARQEAFLPDDSLGTFLMDKAAAQGTALTEKQIKEESAKYTELKEAKEKLEVELAAEKEKYEKLAAEIGVNKAKAVARKASKKTHEEHVKDRKAIIDAAREDLKKIRQDPSLKLTIPYAAELKALAPHVKKYMQDLLNEGVDKFDNIVSDIHAEFKDVLDNLTKRDVIAILAGEHDTKKEQTRNEKANSIRLIKREAELTKQLADARKGLEKAKSTKEETASNRRIDELTEKIKEVKRLNKENAEEAPPTEQKLLSDYIDELTKKADRLAKEIKDKKYLEEKSTPPIFRKSRKAQILEDRVIDLENKIRHDRSADQYNKRSKARRIFDKVMEVLGVRRLVQSAVDISIPFRQGVTLISPRRIDIWAKGFMANLQSVFSPKKFERIMYEIRHDQEYHDMVKDGVVFNDLGSADPNLHNEDFRKSFVYKIPILSEPLKASNRSADAFLNVARLEMYKKMRRVLELKGLTRESDPKAFRFIANWTMSMTGRGRMSNMLENSVAHTVLGNTFYGARLMASRFNLLNPVTYFDPRVPKQAKVEAMKDMAAFTVTIMAAGLALAAAGGAISLDPDDPDFLKVRFGDKVYDISGGLANYVRTFLRIVKAGYTKIAGDKKEGNIATSKAGMSTLNFFRNKLSPNTAYATDAFFGKAYGQEFDPSEIYRIYPMYTDDALKALKDEGVISLATVLLPNIVGIGYSNYPAKDERKVRETFTPEDQKDPLIKLITEDYERNKQESGWLPPRVDSEITRDKQTIKLTPEQHKEFEKLVYDERMKLLKNGDKEAYAKKHDEAKRDYLKVKYDGGRERAVNLFLEDKKNKGIIKEISNKNIEDSLKRATQTIENNPIKQ